MNTHQKMNELIQSTFSSMEALEEANRNQAIRLTAQDLQIADLRAELITAHGEAEERMRERDEARGALARKQRCIDEAMAMWHKHGGLTPGCFFADILRPEVTPTVPANRPQCPQNLNITQGVVPTRDEVFGIKPDPAAVDQFLAAGGEVLQQLFSGRKATPTIETVAEYLKSGEPGNLPETLESSTEVPGANPAVTLAFKKSLNEASAIVAEWPAWKRDALKPSQLESEADELEPATNRDSVTRSLAEAAEDAKRVTATAEAERLAAVRDEAQRSESDGTKALRLVARLAEALTKIMEAPPRTELTQHTEDIRRIASEARGGAE